MTALFRQIYQRFRQSIADGRLQAGDRVPSVRALAAEMNVARGTVEAAYQLLIGEGYLIARGPAGTIVSPQINVPPSIISLTAASKASQHTKGRLPASPLTAALETQPASHHSGESPRPFQMGLPALDKFPQKVWQRLIVREMRGNPLSDLVYPDPQGHAPLRQAIATYLGISRGIDCSAAQVFVCAGYRASLDLICRSVMQRGDACWFEEPGYFMARTFLSNAGMRLVPVPVDDEGLDVATGVAIAPEAKFVVVTPSHQSPMGVSLSLARRHALLAWANAQDSWIIEDDYDSEYRYQGRPLPALKSLDDAGRVLYTGTFSKVLTPGLRLSYLVVPVAQVPRFAQITGEMQNQCPRLLQATLTTFMENGYFARHISKMRGVYAQRRLWLADALDTAFNCTTPGDQRLIQPADHCRAAKVTLHAGGMHLLVMLDDAVDDRAIAARAQSHGLAVQALSSWCTSATSIRGLLLGFTNISSMEEAMTLARRLASAFVP